MIHFRLWLSFLFEQDNSIQFAGFCKRVVLNARIRWAFIFLCFERKVYVWEKRGIWMGYWVLRSGTIYVQKDNPPPDYRGTLINMFQSVHWARAQEPP